MSPLILFSDCNRIIYHHSISIQPFRQCDERNFGISELCRFDNGYPNPQIWGKQVLSQLNNSQLPANISSQRFLNPRLFNATVFKDVKREYDAFEKDIAVLHVFFESPTVLQYTTKQSKTWVDFVSAVGGNGGLFIGFSLVTIVEFFWILIQLLYIFLKPREIVNK